MMTEYKDSTMVVKFIKRRLKSMFAAKERRKKPSYKFDLLAPSRSTLISMVLAGSTRSILFQ